VLSTSCVFAEEVPPSGPKRLAWVREHVLNTVAKFEFTQGYDFRKEPEKLRPFLEAIKAQGFNTWDQMPIGGIWNDREFASLERSLRVAGEVGLKVWATLSPPSGTEEIARMPLDRRREYYYTTVERFARLANEHENFVAFTCDDTDYNWSFFTPEVLAEMARRWRVAKEHPLTKGLGPVGVWQEVSLKPGESTYGYLASPVRPAGAEVLIEVEHQRCPYDGVHYVRQDEVNGVFPLLTVHRVGNGTVVRHYAAVSLGEILGDAYPKLIANLVQGAERE